ncbi:ABC transporter ATP-binding protein uup [Lachnospiraceae bacterium TWA4]|nr:ABC transporter ATP-binding protein uup [Lachnospiraceae bacterium TWA4]
MILSCNHINKAFGMDDILKDVSFHIEDHEKVAIVGINGAGKSTLLKIIIGEEPADSGEVVIAKGKTLGYLAQHQDTNSEETIYHSLLEIKKDILKLEDKIRFLENEMKHVEGAELETLLDQYSKATTAFEQANGYAYKSEVVGVLKGLGFEEEEFNRKINSLSGGQKTRVALAKLLLTKPDIILLDEPINHLDMGSIAWLETFLLNYQGSVIIVAHDRYFLNRIVSKVIELDMGVGTVFLGNYSDYSAKKAQLREAQLKAYFKQQQEIKHQQEVITKLKSFNREKSIKRAESREKMLDKLERLDKPMSADDSMQIEFHPAVTSGNDVMNVEGLTKSFGNLTLFKDVNFEIKRGERVAIIGDNGTGKTTLLKIINEMVKADAGTITLGAKVEIGYYDQEQQLLHEEKTLFDEMQDAYPDMTNTQIRNILASFLFTNDDVFKLVGDLSGGERGRLSLAKLMLSDSNFLILDEPTNHLDIVSKEILENALNHYSGTVLYVSHDRYFINQTATRILALHNENFVNFIGNYDYYLEKKDILLAPKVEEATSKVSTETAAKADWKSNKEAQAAERKRKNEIQRIEKEIVKVEARIDEIDEEAASDGVATNAHRLVELMKEKDQLSKKLDDLYERWSELDS